MKKTILTTVMILISFFTWGQTSVKCDWTKLGFGYGNSCNVYKFELGSIDTCISYTTYIYSYKTGKITDTFKTRTFTKTFVDTGKYKVYISAINKCGRCDTSFYRVLTVTCNPTTIKKCDWHKAGFGYSNKCGKVLFEMGSYIDTCIQYTTFRYRKSNSKLDTIAHDRIFTRTMDTGWYTFKTIFHNKCLNCDTFIYKEIHIGCETNGVNLIEQKPIKIYPNPTNNYLEFEYQGEIVDVIIYDYLGKVIYTGNSTQTQINTELWPSGYFTIKFGNSINRLYIIK
jgi:hypothetical protein